MPCPGTKKSEKWVEDLLEEGYPFEVAFRFYLGSKTLVVKRTLRFDNGVWLVSERGEGFPRQAFKELSESAFKDLSDAEKFFSHLVLPLDLFSGCSSFKVRAFITSRYPLISSPRLWSGDYPVVFFSFQVLLVSSLFLYSIYIARRRFLEVISEGIPQTIADFVFGFSISSPLLIFLSLSLLSFLLSILLSILFVSSFLRKEIAHIERIAENLKKGNVFAKLETPKGASREIEILVDSINYFSRKLELESKKKFTEEASFAFSEYLHSIKGLLVPLKLLLTAPKEKFSRERALEALLKVEEALNTFRDVLSAKPVFSTVSLSALVEGLVEKFPFKNCSISGSEKEVLVKGDPVLLEKAFSAILENYLKSSGEVKVEVSEYGVKFEGPVLESAYPKGSSGRKWSA